MKQPETWKSVSVEVKMKIYRISKSETIRENTVGSRENN